MKVDFFDKLVQSAVANIHTAYIAKVVSLNGNTAMVQPLSYLKDAVGNTIKQSAVSAFIPRNVKYAVKTITYQISDYASETRDVLIPDELQVGDVVYCGVCENDISSAVSGKIEDVPIRRHDINDSVILKVL